VTVITKKLYKQLKCPQLQFKGTFTHGNTTDEQEIYVVKGLRKPLIGRPAITALELVSRINAINSGKQHMLDQHPDLFHGLGNIEEYSVER